MPQILNYQGIWVEIYVKNVNGLFAYGITLDSWHKTWAKRLEASSAGKNPKALAMIQKWGRICDGR